MNSNGCSHRRWQVGISGFKENYPVERAGGDEEEKEHTRLRQAWKRQDGFDAGEPVFSLSIGGRRGQTMSGVKEGGREGAKRDVTEAWLVQRALWAGEGQG